MKGDLPYKGSLSRSFFPGMSKKGVLTWNKRGAGHGAGASTAKLCEACESGRRSTGWQNTIAPESFADMKIGRSCSLVLADATARLF